MANSKMSGQSVVDRLTAAKHSIAGHGLAKSVCKATTEEVMGPKKKHVDYLVQCTNEPNVSIPSLANQLIERCQHQSWVVVFKSLITMHNIMNHGNERFTQYLASNNSTLNLAGFCDKTGVQGYDMSTFIQRYAKYINEKAFSYRAMAFDFCKVKRGKDDGLLRKMNTDKLLKTLPILQQQVDVLLEFDCTPNELTNGVINACFMLMFKDLIRLFACYNDGIINLLEKYFDCSRKQCKDSLDIYKKFVVRMDGVSKFLKTAENVGIDKGDIPDLAKAPSSLLEALEEHLKSLEGNKPDKKTKAPKTVTTAINSMAGSPDPSNLTEDEKRRILAEENQHIEKLKERKESVSTNPFMTSPDGNPPPLGTQESIDLLGAGSPVSAPPTNLASTNPFASAVSPSTTAAAPNPWGDSGTTAPAVTVNGTFNGTSSAHDGFASDASFAAAFGSSQSAAVPVQPSAGSFTSLTPTPSGFSPSTNPPPGFDGFGEVMQPAAGAGGTATGPVAPGSAGSKAKQNLITGDLDSSLMSLAGNLNIGPSIKTKDHKWNPTGPKQMTGGQQWGGSQPMSTTTQPAYPGMQSQLSPGLSLQGVPSLSPMQATAPTSLHFMPAPMMNAGISPNTAYMPHTNGWAGAAPGMQAGMMAGSGMMQPQAGMMPPAYQQQMPVGAGMPMSGGFQPAAAQPQQQQPNLFQQPTRPQANANDPFGLL